MTSEQETGTGAEGGLSRTLRDLEWSRLVAAVAARCRGPLGERLRALPLAQTFEEARRAMDQTAEVLALSNEGEVLPLAGAKEVRDNLSRAARGGSLDGPSLRDVRTTVGAARVLRLFLSRRRDRLGALEQACPLDPTLDSLEDEIASAIDSDGTVADHASPELRRLRIEVGNLRARIVSRLEQMLVEHSDVVQDRFHTIREGRYVIPVRTDAHEKLPGIVHGTSSSGATVFIEPRAMVVQQNRLTLAMGEMEAEEARILAQLTELVAERLPELRAAVDSLDLADLRSASARLAEDLRARPPTLVPEPRIEASDARHPLLALDCLATGTGVVVPNDVALRAGHALVLSGPNAGGKTVALKTLGLFALMARAGLAVPSGEGAVVGFFDPILSDVGDEQSIARNLSTFSAHIRNLARILDEAGPTSMVLLDEVATGTDPGEGGALACAVVDALCRRGAALAVTTHYEPLKAMALSDARLRNASVGFDVEAMAPTFELRMDVPGASSALRVAARFGLDPVVVERAKAMLPEQSRTFDALVQKLEAAHEEVSTLRARLEQDTIAQARLRAQLEEDLAKQRARDKKRLSEEAEKLQTLLREGRDEVRAARAAMRKSPADLALVEAARAAIERTARRVEEEVAEATAPDTPADSGVAPTLESIAPGMRVFVPRLRTEMEILEGPNKGRVRVGAGAVKLWVAVGDVRLPAAAPEPIKKSAAKAASSMSEPLAATPAIRTSDNTVDLRGLRVDEAISMTESFLDRLYGQSEKVGFVLHGLGTGALREAIREYLSGASRYVRTHRPGETGEGGDGITVVLLA